MTTMMMEVIKGKVLAKIIMLLMEQVKNLTEGLKGLIITKEQGKNQLNSRRDSYKKIMPSQRQDFIMPKKQIKGKNNDDLCCGMERDRI